jgi:prolyl oligopeptidase
MTTLRYPDTATVDQVDDYHGERIADPYRWLEDTDAPETAAWIAEQNAVTAAWIGEVADRDDIVARLRALWDHPRASVPTHRGKRWFQLRNSGLQDQDVLVVMDAPDDEGRVLLDPNAMSDDGTVSLSAAAVSRDARLLAYATSAAGSDWMTWRVRDIATGEDLDDVLEWSKFAGAAWLPDGSGFLYARFDAPAEGEAYEEANRNQRLWLHRVGTSQDDDVLVYARPDQPEWMFSPSVTEDGRYLVLHVSHGTDPRNRLFYADLGEDAEERTSVEGIAFLELLTDFDAAYGLVASVDRTFYVLTDRDAPRSRLVAIDLDDPEPSRWRDVIAETEDSLERATLVGGRLIAGYLHHARSVLRRFTLDGEPDGEVALPGIGSVEGMAGKAEDDDLYFSFAGFSQPSSIHRHTVSTGATALVRAAGVDIDPDAFVTEQVFVTSADGTQVPMFLVRRADVEPDGGVPTLLWGYGGFRIPVTPMFRVAWHVWVERGGMLAVPNLRGGGEYGQAWHDGGRLANKQTVFDDAIAAAEHLVASGWTRPDRLAISGGSNGGLLAGACLTQRPDLFGAAVPEVGVLDMLRFHHFTIGWAWISDYGSADDPEQFRWLRAYSPLHNIDAGTRYPATLITTGDHDDRVVPGHSFKFAAALQAAQRASGGEAPTLIRVQTQAGHGAGKPTRVLIEERADVLAFLTRALGVGAQG